MFNSLARLLNGVKLTKNPSATALLRQGITVETSAHDVNFTGGTQKKGAIFGVSIIAPEGTSEDKPRPPLNLATVIDVSGSMSGEKLQLTQESLEYIIQQLQPDDSVSVVAFESKVHVHQPLTTVTAQNKEQLAAIVNQLHTLGATNLSGGLLEGLAQLADYKQHNQDAVNALLLLTDGCANAGIQSPQRLIKAMREVNQQGRKALGKYTTKQVHQDWAMYQQGRTTTATEQLKKYTDASAAELKKLLLTPAVSTPGGFDVQVSKGTAVSAFGFGTDHDSGFLKQIASAGNGDYQYIRRPSDVGEIFANYFGGLTSTSAEDCIVTITPKSDNYVFNGFFTDYPHRRAPELHPNAYQVFIPNIQEGERKDLLFSADVTPGNRPNGTDLEMFDVDLSFRDVALGKTVQRKLPVVGTIGDSIGKNAELDASVNRIVTVNAMQLATTMVTEQQNFETAKQLLQVATEHIRQSTTAEAPAAKELLAQLKECEDQCSYSPEEFMQGGHINHWHAMQGSHSQQRAMSGFGSYETAAKMRRLKHYRSSKHGD
eukprot:TRINITY_DN3515_c0_g1_i1.p1 TRINITY_DN3515_c0_g1~~TRINITY_DN3515_c0_g1_i1.p1  ORF type:complete len:544 (-),score=68.42 TRINITY_DN3515_c0_g1_i1:175-1806(-)